MRNLRLRVEKNCTFLHVSGRNQTAHPLPANRLMKFLIFCMTLLLITSLEAEPVALGNGEKLTYKVSWGPFWYAGEIIISARDENEGLSHRRVTTITSTRGVIRGIFPFDGGVNCLFDARDGRLLAASAETSAGKKKTKALAVFDYPAGKIHYVDYLRSERTADLPLPQGNPMDLITSLVQTRAWNLKPGERKPATVMFDDDFYELVIVADHYETVKTTWGECQALVLKPIMENNPKGMFKKGGSVRVWISQDARHLPVKFEVSLKYGTATAMLIEHEQPSTPPRLAHADTYP